ncbi:MAG: HD domain-containing protein [bacterium]|nr:HD domain-containing protein [bacterium]
MKKIIDFLTKAGTLKDIRRRGWVLRGVKNPESIADHTFRMVLASWLLGDKAKLNLGKVIKMALIHDLCEVYAGDSTPYDVFLSKGKRGLKKAMLSWPGFSKIEKQKTSSQKYKRENKSLQKLIVNLPPRLRDEIRSLWSDYERGLTREGRFVRQIDRLENLLQALEYWQKDKKFPINPWWVQIKELVDYPELLEFTAALEKKFMR